MGVCSLCVCVFSQASASTHTSFVSQLSCLRASLLACFGACVLWGCVWMCALCVCVCSPASASTHTSFVSQLSARAKREQRKSNARATQEQSKSRVYNTQGPGETPVFLSLCLAMESLAEMEALFDDGLLICTLTAPRCG